MDRTTNPRGLGSKSFNIRPVGNTHLLISPNSDHEHISDLLDTYEIERISRELEYYIQEAAKSTTDVKSNGLIGSDGRRSGLRRAISMPRLPPERDASGGGMKKTSEKKSKEIIKASMPPVRDTSGGGGHRSGLQIAMSMPRLPPERDASGGGMKKTSEKKSKEITKASMPPVRDTSGTSGGHRSGLQRMMSMSQLPLKRDTSGDGMKKTSEKKSKEIIKASMPLVRDTSGGGGRRSGLQIAMSMPRLPPERDANGGGMKKTSEKKSKEIIKASMPPVRDTSGGGGHRSGLQRVMLMPQLPLERHTSGGGMKKTSEKKSRDIIKASMPPVRDTSGGGGLKKKSEAKSKEIIKVSQPEGDTSGGGGAGGMKKNSIVEKRKEIINWCFWLKLASMAQVAPQSVGVPLQSWDLSIRKAMAGASEGIQCHGIKVGWKRIKPVEGNGQQWRLKSCTWVVSRESCTAPNLSRFILAAEKESCKMDSEMVVHNGGCHCRSVRWRVQSPSSVVAWQCNCSDCSMRGNTHFIVPSERFELLGDSEQFITTYTFGTHTAKHTFCKVCGITSFYTPRSNPDGVAVTFRCVDPGTLTHVEIKQFDGQIWEDSYNLTGISSCSKEGK
ncbi:hypothetical protein RHMOL_Rhmol08G0023200 [Rhododendron molle]|uniref:Uncharacterized protein n=1 Tax=Rhododendron molle TaxID=49168 RepID=A0ACC0MK94_RHOML|nr:hypothetical protein RHMOL_Rhmol08G0023200 [Rhododendron molle]